MRLRKVESLAQARHTRGRWSWSHAWLDKGTGGWHCQPRETPSPELLSPHPKPDLWQNPEPEPTLTLAMGQILWGLQKRAN